MNSAAKLTPASIAARRACRRVGIDRTVGARRGIDISLGNRTSDWRRHKRAILTGKMNGGANDRTVFCRKQK
jgi:hypothetical protein